MTLGERVKLLRQKAGMTQDELAKEIGYSTKTSISKIENNILDINQSTIVALARALKTTPSVIMGWTEIAENNIATTKLILSEKEERLVTAYRKHPEHQSTIDKILDIDSDTIELHLAASDGATATVKVDDADELRKDTEALRRKNRLL